MGIRLWGRGGYGNEEAMGMRRLWGRGGYGDREAMGMRLWE